MVNALPIRPTIVWVNGSFSPASFYADMAEHIRSQGYEIIVKTLPSSARTPPEQPATLAEDAAFFHDIVEGLSDQGKDVVLVMHSYGGVVGSECSRGLSKEERAAVGKAGGITRLVFLTCVVPEVGASLQDTTSSGSPPWLIVREDVGLHRSCEKGTCPLIDLGIHGACSRGEWASDLRRPSQGGRNSLGPKDASAQSRKLSKQTDLCGIQTHTILMDLLRERRHIAPRFPAFLHSTDRGGEWEAGFGIQSCGRPLPQYQCTQGAG